MRIGLSFSAIECSSQEQNNLLIAPSMTPQWANEVNDPKQSYTILPRITPENPDTRHKLD